MAEAIDGAVRSYEVHPEQFGMSTAPRDTLVGGAAAEARPVFQCNELYRPDQLTPRGMMTLVKIDLATDGIAPDATGLLSDGWTVYASQENLYVAQTMVLSGGTYDGPAWDPPGPDAPPEMQDLFDDYCDTLAAIQTEPGRDPSSYMYVAPCPD